MRGRLGGSVGGMALGFALACASGPDPSASPPSVSSPSVALPSDAASSAAAPRIDRVASAEGTAAASGQRIPTAPPISRVVLDRKELERSLQDVEGVGDVIGLRPNLTLHGLDGVDITAIPAGSPLAGLGLQAGDRILRVDGKPLTSLDGALAIGQSLETATSITADLLRDGQTITLRVDLK